MKYTFPADYDQASCFLVPINSTLVPIIAGKLKDLEKPYSWHTDEDYERGYNAIAELEACMTRLCVEQLIESNDRLYRMLDTAIFGRAYAVNSLDPLVVLPRINPTHALVYEDDASILGRIHISQQLLENALNGTSTQHYDRANGVRDLLEQIIAKLEESGSDNEDLLAELQVIAGLLA